VSASVSDRPYGKYVQILDNPLSMGSGEFLLWEYPLCYWLEKEGYDVTYCSNVDNIEPANLARCQSDDQRRPRRILGHAPVSTTCKQAIHE